MFVLIEKLLARVGLKLHVPTYLYNYVAIVDKCGYYHLS